RARGATEAGGVRGSIGPARRTGTLPSARAAPRCGRPTERKLTSGRAAEDGVRVAGVRCVAADAGHVARKPIRGPARALIVTGVPVADAVVLHAVLKLEDLRRAIRVGHLPGAAEDGLDLQRRALANAGDVLTGGALPLIVVGVPVAVDVSAHVG